MECEEKNTVQIENKESKICKKCGLDKELSRFSKKQTWCKDCIHIQNKERYHENREERLARARQYQIDNKEQISIRGKIKYENKKEEILARNRDYYSRNKEKIIAYKREYYLKNKEKIVARTRKKEYNKNFRLRHRERLSEQGRLRRKLDVCFRLRNDVSRIIAAMLRKQKNQKNGSISKYLPYTILQLKEHLESQFEPWMSWENWGQAKLDGIKRWQIDHIIPQSKLLYDSMEHENFQKCWALSNLRPLEAIENIKKSDKLIG